ncbi:Trk system potassium transporter TrkA [Muribaculaceae bacterium Isolate-104 (HZI)]|jgi:trk system potassium uptake protein TrkA|nr:Trk system potassium transporter TrkA [Muribaculaceae bacterium Isolate-104 (HZI)]
MKIVIAGAGEVGSHLAKLLSREAQDIILIDQDADKLAVIDANYNLMTLRGSPMSFHVLKEAGVERCDLFIAVTPFETNNVIAASVAKSLGARKTVARIDNYEFMERSHAEFFSRMGVNKLIYPEYLAAQEIMTSLERTWVRTWFEIHNGELIVVGVKIRDANATLCGMQLKQLAMQQHFFHVAAIRRSHETIIPRGDDRIRLNDIVYFTTTRNHIDSIREMCGKRQEDIRKVLIMGGSRIAVRLIAMASNKYKFKIIDIDRSRCEKLCEKCADVRIVHGDARDVETLVEEGIDDMDAFIALTDSSETNILASLSAKEHGVYKTIAEVEDLQFISEAENLNIGTIINKKLLASSNIFQLLLDTDSSTSKFMALADADVAEIEVKPKSKITKAPVKDLSLSRDMTIAGLIRDGKGMLVSGNTHIQPGDRVVVFCLAGAIHKIERIFS